MFKTARIASLALASAALVAAVSPAAAQSAPPAARNAVYVELLGNGIVYSVNYDRLITPNVSARVGVSAATAEDGEGDRATIITAPVTASYLWGRGNSKFETGIGVLVASASLEDLGDDLDIGDDVGDTSVLGTATLGYRYQPADGGFVFRAGLTPIFTTDSFVPWFGVSFGYAF